MMVPFAMPSNAVCLMLPDAMVAPQQLLLGPQLHTASTLCMTCEALFHALLCTCAQIHLPPGLVPCVVLELDCSPW